MLAPSLVFGFILSTLYGSGVHFLVGGDARRLALLLLSGWMGFALGQIAGDIFNIAFMRMGTIYFFSATGGALMALLLAVLLTRRSD
jgi:hypothetical protein